MASLGHRQKPNSHYPSARLTLWPAWCRCASCSAARNPSPSLPWTAARAKQGAASMAGAGAAVRMRWDGNREGEGHSEALLTAGTCPAAWQTNVSGFFLIIIESKEELSRDPRYKTARFWCVDALCSVEPLWLLWLERIYAGNHMHFHLWNGVACTKCEGFNFKKTCGKTIQRHHHKRV